MNEGSKHDGGCHEHGDHRHGLVDEAVIERAASILRAAGDPARLRLLERLARGEHCVSELADETSEALSTVSQRLRTLRAEKLVTRRRAGKHIYYALADEHVAGLIRTVLAHAEEASRR